MSLRVTQGDDGQFYVLDIEDAVLAGPFKANSAAWREMDRIEGSPISRSESVSDWLFTKDGKGLSR